MIEPRAKEAMRRALITESLLFGVQTNRISGREYDDVIRLLKLNNYRLDKNCVMLTDVRRRVLQCCPTLRDDNASLVSVPTIAVQPNQSKAAHHIESFGLQPSTTRR